MKAAQARDGEGYILYDADAITDSYAENALFDPELIESRGWLTGSVPGRGATWFFKIDDEPFVLRHYHRGGQMAHWLGDRYLWTGLERTRAFREWRLLAQLVELGLPVPTPVAARVVRDGRFYRADLITRELPGASLAYLLTRAMLSENQWRAIGRCIRRFHRKGVYHADLNAHNILVDQNGRIHVIDFDKGRLRSGSRWQQDNLARLCRSLRKLASRHATFNYSARNFEVLKEGYYSAY